MNIKTIFFDLGGVLINFSHEKMCRNIAEFCGLDLGLVKTHLFEKGLSERYEKGDIDSNTLHQHFCNLSGQSLSLPGLMDATSQIFSQKAEMPPILERCKQQGIQLILLSNTCEPHFLQARKQFPFLSLFDGFILSYEVGARKPEKKIYDAALELANCPKEQCLYTDDVQEYVDAAIKFGIDSHLFKESVGLEEFLEKRGYKTL